MTGARIMGLGTALPDRIVTSTDLERDLGLAEGWIEERTGIVERHIAAATDTASSLGTEASRSAVANAGLQAGDIDMVICATLTPDWSFPATACLIQSALGIDAPAFDLNAGCSGFLFALAQAGASIRAGVARNVLVVGTEVLSRITDWNDPKTAILFGDGAGAVVVGAHDSDSLGPFNLHSDGSRPELLFLQPHNGKIHMEGRAVYRAAVLGMGDAVGRTLHDSGTDAEHVDLVIAHQANARILEGVAQRLDLPMHKMFSNIDRYGNTSAASIPIALAEAEEQGALTDGDLLVLTAFGAGFTWGAGLVHWASIGPRHPALATAGALDA